MDCFFYFYNGRHHFQYFASVEDFFCDNAVGHFQKYMYKFRHIK